MGGGPKPTPSTSTTSTPPPVTTTSTTTTTQPPPPPPPTTNTPSPTPTVDPTTTTTTGPPPPTSTDTQPPPTTSDNPSQPTTAGTASTSSDSIFAPTIGGVPITISGSSSLAHQPSPTTVSGSPLTSSTESAKPGTIAGGSTPSQSDTAASNGISGPVVIITGVVVGLVVISALLVSLCYLLRRKRRKQNSISSQNPEVPTKHATRKTSSSPIGGSPTATAAVPAPVAIIVNNKSKNLNDKNINDKNNDQSPSPNSFTTAQEQQLSDTEFRRLHQQGATLAINGKPISVYQNPQGNLVWSPTRLQRFSTPWSTSGRSNTKKSTKGKSSSGGGAKNNNNLTVPSNNNNTMPGEIRTSSQSQDTSMFTASDNSDGLTSSVTADSEDVVASMAARQVQLPALPALAYSMSVKSGRSRATSQSTVKPVTYKFDNEDAPPSPVL